LIYLQFVVVPREAVDLVFAIEGSKALKKNFEDIKKTVIKMLIRYKIAKYDTHVGVLEFSDSPSKEIRLDATFAKETLTKLVSEIQPSEGENVNTDKALHEAAKMFTVKYGGRAGYPKALVLITGSKSDGEEPLNEAVKPLKEEGIQLTVITVGNDTDPELPKITPNLNKVDDPEDLPEKTDSVVDKINKDVKESKLFIDFHQQTSFLFTWDILMVMILLHF
jgi:hypothetical protein